MDGLIVLLMIIGLIARISKKKKKNEQARRRKAGFNSAADLPAEGKKPSAAGKIADAFETVDKAVLEQVKIPYTKEEWSKFLKENNISKPNEAARKRAQKAMLRSGDSSLIAQMQSPRPAAAESGEGREFEKLAAQRLRPDDRHLEGESHKEHAEHKKRIAEDEARLHREREELRELRNVNLKKLRSAVVMSEVLGKPVALRGNTLGRRT